jgi:hypothetical protein
MKSRKPKVYCKSYLPLLGGSVSMLVSAGGTGKALKFTEPVLTPAGFKPIWKLKIGDKVIGSHGIPINVTGVFPQGIRKLYRVTFIDGTSVDCDGEHIWSVYNGSSNKYRHALTNKTTLELMNGKFSREKYDKRYGTTQIEYYYSIPIPKPMEFGTKPDIDIDPYLLGLLLGDGGLSSESGITFTNGDKELIDTFISKLPLTDQTRIVFWNNAYHVNVSSPIKRDRSKTRQIIDKLGLGKHLSIHKFIPEIFKNADLETRKQIYQGLIDTDGYILDGNLEKYSTSSRQLAKDFLFVGRSLGNVLTIKERIPIFTYKGEKKEGQRSYRIYEKKTKKKTIVSIKKIDIDEAVCITVDAEDKLFVTSGFNLTHNSFSVIRIAMVYVAENPDRKAVLWLTEDSEGENYSRFSRLVGEFKQDTKYFQERVHFVVSSPLRFTKLEDGNATVTTEFLQTKLELADYSMIVFDPLLQFNGCDENSNTHAGVMMGAFKSWAAKEDKEILLLHHVTIYQDGGIKARGAGEWQNGCRCVYSVAYPMKVEGKKQVKDISSCKRVFELIKDNGIGYQHFTNINGQKEKTLFVFPEEVPF